MKRAKDKYMINRTKYKDIKRYDHRVGEAIATAIGLITVLAMIAMVPIIVIGGAIMLIWSIFAG